METNQVISYKLFNPTYFSMFRLPYLDDNTCILFNTNIKKVSEEVRRDFKLTLSSVIIPTAQ